MKAIFMTKIGGKLVEVERREIPSIPVYYVAVREPITFRAMEGEDIPQMPTPKRERWVAYSMPCSSEGFAVFLFEGIE